MKPGKGRTVGVDLGTTNSVVAHINEGKQPEVISSREGGRTIPSVFAVNQAGQKLVGSVAVDQEGVNPANTVRSIKRKMGLMERIAIHDKEYSPEEISAEILRKIKSDAEAFFGESVTRAVITVPAYFNSHKRQCTITAGELAGLEVLRVISEPTAAALAYGLDKRKNETILVYDLGGGTFDVSVLFIGDDGIFEVKSTDGDDHLGGDDFDEAIVKLINEAFVKDQPDMAGRTPNIVQKTRLRDAAEKAKFALSASDFAQVSIPYYDMVDGLPVNLGVTITRSDFEEAIAPLIERTRKCVFDALEAAHMVPSQINEVIFVGGSTRVPIIATEVERWTGKKPNRSVNPDEAVALGAAVQAAVLSGDFDRDVLLLDVIPLSLGIHTAGGVFTSMIDRNTTIPTQVSREFQTDEDYQTKAVVEVYQGERPRAKDNMLLGRFEIELDPAPRGQGKVEVTYTVDANAILSVAAIDKLTGKKKEVTVTGTSTITDDDIARILAEAAANAESDRRFIILSDLRSLLKSFETSAEAILRESSDVIGLESIKDLKDLLESIKEAFVMEDVNFLESLAEAANDSIQEAQNKVHQAAEKLIPTME